MLNHALIYQIHKLRHGDPQYCFPLRMFLGENGLYENHELKGKTFVKIETGEEYVVDNVYVHWWQGWYFIALARNKGNSHVSITWNINSVGDFTYNNYILK